MGTAPRAGGNGVDAPPDLSARTHCARQRPPRVRAQPTGRPLVSARLHEYHKTGPHLFHSVTRVEEARADIVADECVEIPKNQHTTYGDCRRRSYRRGGPFGSLL